MGGIKIQIEDLPTEFRKVAVEIGVEPAVALMNIRGGEQFYVPTRDAVLRSARIRVIKSKYNGSNCKELACKYGVSIRWVRAIVRSDENGNSTGCDISDKQQPLFPLPY